MRHWNTYMMMLMVQLCLWLLQLFWNEDNDIFISDEINDFNNNGGEFILNIAINPDELKEYWRVEYDFTLDELNAVEYIFKN